MINIELPRTDKLITPQISLRETYKVQCTTDYSKFKLLEDNRPIDHEKAIANCVCLVGFLPIPAIVNEFMQICDGQGRYEVCKKFNLPFYYMIVPGVRIEHVRKINYYMTKWKLRNFVDSYSRDNISYAYYKALQTRYPGYMPRILYAAATGKLSTFSSNVNPKIENGELSISDTEYNDAIRKLDWLNQFSYVWDSKIFGGRRSDLQLAMLFAYQNPSVNNERLVDKFLKFAYRDIDKAKRNPLESRLANIGRFEYCMDLISEIYNKGVTKNSSFDRIDLKHDWKFRNEQ